jgi:hypothetical protein
MSIVTFLWSLSAALGLVLAAVSALAWLVDRRDIAKLMFCIIAIATAWTPCKANRTAGV